MAEYVPTDWADGTTPVNEANLDKMEQGILAAVAKDPVVAAAVRIISSKLLLADAQPAFRILGSGEHQWGPGGSTVVDASIYRHAAKRLAAYDTALRIIRVNVTDPILEAIKTAGDANLRFYIQTDGKMYWGDGTAAPDVDLYRVGADILATDDRFLIIRVNDLDIAFCSQKSGDAQSKWRTYANGRMEWGPGTGATDVVMYRSAQDILKMDDKFDPAALNVPTKAGVPVDADFSTLGVAADGDTVVDTTNQRIYARVGGLWKYVKLGTTDQAGADLSFDGDWVAGTYQDGDVVVKDGVAFMCVGGPTTVAPDASVWGGGTAALTARVAATGGATPNQDLTFPGVNAIHTYWVFGGVTTGASIRTITMAPGLGALLTIYNQGAGLLKLVCNAPAGTGSKLWLGGSGNGSGTDYVMQAGDSITLIADSSGWWVEQARSLAQGTAPAYGTSLPTAPVDGQEAVLTDSLTAPTYAWRFRYTASITDTQKWVFVGGAPWSQFAAGAQNCTSTTYVDLATVLSLAIPRVGYYQVRATVAWQSGSNHEYTGIMLNGVQQAYAWSEGVQRDGHVVEALVTAATVGHLLKMQHKVDTGTTAFNDRMFSVTPVRVG